MVRKICLYSIVLSIVVCLSSCMAITHHKKKLINPNIAANQKKSIKLNGFYYAEFESDKLYESEQIKYITALILYEDGFLIKAGTFKGISKFYCTNNDNLKIENSYESALNKFESSLSYLNNNQNIKVYRSCKYLDNDIDRKGLFLIKNDSIIIQYYHAEFQNLNKDSFNSYYLHELQGVIINDESFKIIKKINYRDGSTENINMLFKFKHNINKPQVSNYFTKWFFKT